MKKKIISPKYVGEIADWPVFSSASLGLAYFQKTISLKPFLCKS